jgi:hypothetical protein
MKCMLNSKSRDEHKDDPVFIFQFAFQNYLNGACEVSFCDLYLSVPHINFQPYHAKFSLGR